MNIVSTGGNVHEAIQIGKLIRKLNLAANVPSTANVAPQARVQMCGIASRIARSPCTCASACFLIWAGGFSRSGNDIHIHRIAFDSDYFGSLPPSSASSEYRRGLEGVHRYLQDMEIPESIYERMVRMPSYATEQLDYNTVSFMTWPPSIGEWIKARCGNINSANFGQCTLDQQTQAARTALTSFRADR